MFIPVCFTLSLIFLFYSFPDGNNPYFVSMCHLAYRGVVIQGQRRKRGKRQMSQLEIIDLDQERRRGSLRESI